MIDNANKMEQVKSRFEIITEKSYLFTG